jgi:hypothetical protein
VRLRASVLLRRADAVAVIGAALLAKASGVGHRPIADALRVRSSTVRGVAAQFPSADTGPVASRPPYVHPPSPDFVAKA